MAISLQDIKNKFNQSNTPAQPRQSSNGPITTTIKVEQVFGDERLNKNGKPYTMVNVVYRNDKDQLKEKKFPSFTEFGKKAVQVLEENKLFEVTLSKNADGFWEWLSITPA